MRQYPSPIWRSIACAAVITGGLTAAVIPSYARAIDGQTIMATDSSGTTTTPLSGKTIAATATQYIDGGMPIARFLDFERNSMGSVSISAGQLLQPLDGTIAVTAQALDAGLNYLSRVFTDFVFGIAGGFSLALDGSEPPGTGSFTSDGLNVSLAGLPRATSLAFADAPRPTNADRTAPHEISSGTTSAHSASDASGRGALMLLGVGLSGIGTITELRRRRRAAKVRPPSKTCDLSARQAG